jgi:hypothetical protein
MDASHTMSAVYANSQVPAQVFVTGAALGTLRNDFKGWVGMRFSVGASPVSATHLGRIFVGGNSGTHTVKLVRAADGVDVPGGSVSLNMVGGSPGQFKYVPLASPVFLAANTAYYVVSQEFLGGDQWYDMNTVLTTTGVAACNGPVWRLSSGTTWNFVSGNPNRSYGPVNFGYSAGTPAGLEALSEPEIAPATPRNGAATLILSPTESGLKLTVAGQPGKSYRIEVSNDLQNWSSFQRLTLRTGASEQWIDTSEDSSPQARFYRVMPLSERE